MPDNAIDPSLIEFWNKKFPDFKPKPKVEETVAAINGKPQEEHAGRNYQDPIKGASKRWKASWENGTNPVKTVFDNGLATFLLGPLQLLYTGYSGVKNALSPDGVSKTVNHFKNGEYLEGAGSAVGDAFDLLPLASAKGQARIMADRMNKVPLINKFKDIVQGVKQGMNNPNPKANLIKHDFDHLQFPAKQYDVSNVMGFVDANNNYQGKTINGRHKWFGLKLKDDFVDIFATINSKYNNTLNLHFDKNVLRPALKFASKAPRGIYVGDAYGVSGNEATNIYPVGQYILNKRKDPSFNITKALFERNRLIPSNYSADSYKLILKRANDNPRKYELTYLPGIYSKLNNEGIYDDLIQRMDAVESMADKLKIANEYIKMANPSAREAIIKGSDILFPHPMLYVK